MDPKNGKIKQIEWFKFVPRLILKWRIRKFQYFDPKLPTFAFSNSFTEHLIYVLNRTQNGRIMQIGVKKQIDLIIFYHYETFLFYTKSVTSVF